MHWPSPLERSVFASILLLGIAACASGPTAADHLDDARFAIEDHRFRRAEVHLNIAEDRGADRRNLRSARARLARRRASRLLERNRRERAMEMFQRAGDRHPDSAASAAMYRRALEIGERIGRSPQTLARIASAVVEAQPESRRARRAAGKFWESAGRPERALENYKWIWERESRPPDIGRRLASVYRELDRIEDAIDVLETILENNPKNAQTGIALARLYSDNGRAERALAIYETLLERFPDHPGILLRFSRFLKRRGRAERAAKLEDRAYDAMPGSEKRRMRKLR